MARPRKGSTPRVTRGVDAFKKGLERKGNPDVKFLADLERYDRTEVAGKNPDKHYRWCRARDKGLRERQGYTKSDDPELVVSAPGGETTWAAEGVQAKTAGSEMILMEMPKERFELRQAYKQQVRDEQSAIMDADLRHKAGQGIDPSHASMLPDGDSFLEDLKRSG